MQIGNETEAGWSLIQLNLDHVIGTGLALQPYYVEGAQDQINLYSQKSDLNLSLTIWRPDSGGNEGMILFSQQNRSFLPTGSETH